MFTGIIEETGIIESAAQEPNGLTLKIKAQKTLEGTKLGDSIAVNGVCLTATQIAAKALTFFVMNESLSKTYFAKLRAGQSVNLERAATLSTRLGGHLVSGHIDGTGKIEKIKKDGAALVCTVVADENILKYIIKKGSVAVDGISLTVSDCDEKGFQVSIIPHTQTATSLGEKQAGDPVNIECDIIGKYVEKLLKAGEKKDSKIDLDFLKNNGF